MKTAIFKITFVAFVLVSAISSAQDFQGKAYYQTKRMSDFDLESTGMSEDQKRMIQERLKKRYARTYVMDFNRNESVYAVEEELDNASNSNGGPRMVMMGGPDNSGKFYKNTKDKTFANEQNFFGKQFLIDDKLTEYNWEITKESKNIGQYKCFKATATIAADENSEEQIITAWYTPQIPINQGPESYWGLPGLILQLEANSLEYLCTKIVLNSKDKFEINKPTKGKVVSQSEFDTIREKKMQEMERNRGREGKNDGRMRVRIGG